MRFGKNLTVGIILLMTSPLFAGSQSVIKSLNAQITVKPDASLDVSETLQLSSPLKNGTLPLTRELYTNSPHQYEVRGVTLDGVPISYHVHVGTHQLSIDMGEDKQALPPGNYVYTINYHAKDAIEFGSTADTLAWKISNSGLNLPIEKTSATITLPDAARIVKYTAHLSNGSNNAVTIDQAEAGVFSASTTQVLTPGQYLYLSISWPTGIIHSKSYPQVLESNITANRVNEWELGITFTVLLYYLIFWFRIGRNLNDTHLMPLFQPPAGISAAAARYLLQMRFDDKALIVAILSLATKGYIHIHAELHHIALRHRKEATAKLEHEEEVLLLALFEKGDTLTLNKAHRHRLKHAKNMLRSTLKSLYEQLYFVSNRGYIRLGFLLSSAAFIAPIFSSTRHFHTLMAITGLCLFGYMLYRLGKRFLRTASLATHLPTFLHVTRAFIELIILAATAVLSIYTLNLFSDNIPLITLILLGFLLVINLVFYHLMRSPTPTGRDALNHIEGFKLFFHTTEKLRFAALSPPDMNPALLDRYIPYAIAMGEENAWGERAMQVLQASPQTAYTTNWLTLRENHPTPLRRFASHILALLHHALHQSGV